MECIGTDSIRHIMSFLRAKDILILYCTSRMFYLIDNIVEAIRLSVKRVRACVATCCSNAGVLHFLHDAGPCAREFADAIMRIRSPELDLSPVFIYEVVSEHYEHATRIAEVCGFDRLSYSSIFFMAFPNAEGFSILMRDAEKRRKVPTWLAMQETASDTVSGKCDSWRQGLSFEDRMIELTAIVSKDLPKFFREN